MTPEEFENKMKEINSLSVEERHGVADDMMCEILKTLGYEKGVEIFRKMVKYYA